jgi:hypothetical protein
MAMQEFDYLLALLGICCAVMALCFFFTPIFGLKRLNDKARAKAEKTYWTGAAGTLVLAIVFFCGSGVLKQETTPANSSRPPQETAPGNEEVQVTKARSPVQVEDIEKLNSACAKANARIVDRLSAFGLTGDLSFSDSHDFKNGKANVTVTVRLLSEDAKTFYADGTLQKKVYPEIKAAYKSFLELNGIYDSAVFVTTDFKF